MARFEGIIITLIGLILLCIGVIVLATPYFEYASSLFVGGILFLLVGIYIIEFWMHQEEKPRKR